MICGGAETVMLVPGSSYKYRLSLAERFDCIETIINQLLADSYQNLISEWQVTTKLHQVAGYKAIPTHPSLWKNCLPWNWSLLPKSLGTTDLMWKTYKQGKANQKPVKIKGGGQNEIKYYPWTILLTHALSSLQNHSIQRQKSSKAKPEVNHFLLRPMEKSVS